MRILFLDFQHIPPSGATINCIQALRRQLKKRDVECDVLSLQPDKADLSEQEDSYGRVYLETTWADRGRMRRKEGEPLQKYFLHLPLAIVFRTMHRLLSDGYTRKEKVFSYKACGRFRKRLAQLCKQNRYDWVAAVSSPYCMHDIACHADLHGAQLALYYFDPYAAHPLLSPENEKRRLQQECENLEKADVVFTSLEHREDWQSTALSQYLGKVQFIPYPNLTPDKGNPEPVPALLSPDEITVVYLGNFYDGVRCPKYMFSLFGEMLNFEPRLRLIVAGRISGAEVERQMQDAQRKLQGHLICLDAIPYSQALWLTRQSDCLINIGNRARNLMPSKLLDYIASGKPILNISSQRPCNTEPYILRYPRAIQFYEENLRTLSGLRLAAQKAVEFVHANRGQTLPWPDVQNAMRGFTAEDVAEQFLAALEKTQRSGA